MNDQNHPLRRRHMELDAQLGEALRNQESYKADFLCVLIENHERRMLSEGVQPFVSYTADQMYTEQDENSDYGYEGKITYPSAILFDRRAKNGSTKYDYPTICAVIDDRNASTPRYVAALQAAWDALYTYAGTHYHLDACAIIAQRDNKDVCALLDLLITPATMPNILRGARRHSSEVYPVGTYRARLKKAIKYTKQLEALTEKVKALTV